MKKSLKAEPPKPKLEIEMSRKIHHAGGAGNGLFVSNPLISGFLYYCQGQGLAPDRILGSTGTTFEQLLDIDGKTSEVIYDLVVEQAARLSNDVHLGLNYGRHFNLQHIGILGYLMMNCETFGQSLAAYETFQDGLGESLSIRHSIDQNHVIVQLDLFGGEKSGRHRVESFLSSCVMSCLQLTGRGLRLSSCETPYGTVGNSQVYIDALGCAPSQSAGTRFTLERSYLDLPVIHSTPDLLDFFERGLLAKRESRPQKEFTKKVRREILRRIGKERLEDLTSISKALGLSERTLQTRLEEEGVKFRNLLEDCQLDFSARFLRLGSPIAEISHALGFSEPSAFQRAFKRWTGQSPAQFRSQPPA